MLTFFSFHRVVITQIVLILFPQHQFDIHIAKCDIFHMGEVICYVSLRDANVSFLNLRETMIKMYSFGQYSMGYYISNTVCVFYFLRS